MLFGKDAVDDESNGIKSSGRDVATNFVNNGELHWTLKLLIF